MRLCCCLALALLLVAGAALAAPPEAPPKGEPVKPPETARINERPTVYEPKAWAYLDQGLPGLSARMLKAHYGLYQGYVKKINEVSERLADADRSGANYSYNYYSELKRRESVPLMGAYLHELYFDNLAPPATLDPNSPLAQAMARDFGSVDAWWEDARAVCLSTLGWCVTTYNLRDGKLHNYLIQEHNVGYPAWQVPVVVIDSWEHAFALDYGTDRAAYLKAVRQLINWPVCQARFQAAIKHTGAAK